MSSLPHFLSPDDPLHLSPLHLSSDEEEVIYEVADSEEEEEVLPDILLIQSDEDKPIDVDHVSDSSEEEPQQPWALPTGYEITKEDYSGGMEVKDTITDLVYAQKDDAWILVTNPITLPIFRNNTLINIAMDMIANNSQEIEILPPAGYAFFTNKVIREWDTESPTWYLLNVHELQYWRILKDDLGDSYYENIKSGQVAWEVPPVLIADKYTQQYNHFLIQQNIKNLLVGKEYELPKIQEVDEDYDEDASSDPGASSSDPGASSSDPGASSSVDDDDDDTWSEIANQAFQRLSSSLFSIGDFVTFKYGWDAGLTDQADVRNSGFVQSMGSENWEIMDIGNDVENPYAVIPIIIYDYQLKKQFVGINDEIEDQTLILIHEKYLEKTTDLSLQHHKSEITMARQRRKASLAQLAQDAEVKEKAKQHKKRQIQRRRQRKKAQQIALEQANKQASAFASLLAAPGISSLAMTGTMPSTSITGMRN